MKKSIIFICALGAMVALMAVALQKETKEDLVEVSKQESKQVSSAISFDHNFVDYMNESKIPNMVFNIDSRFIWEITQEDVLNARKIEDLFPAEAMEGVSSVEENRVTLIGEGTKEVVEWGTGLDLNHKQQMLLKTMNYSTDFYVEAYAMYGDGIRRKIVYFHTIIPENPATYDDGLEDLVEYIEKEGRTASSEIDQEKLKPGRIRFTINEKGEMKNLEKTSTSGYDELDDQMLKTMKNLPKGWEPATNAEGKPVAQTLFLFFGIQGC